MTGVTFAIGLLVKAVVVAALLHISAHELVPAWVNCSDEKQPHEQAKSPVAHVPEEDFAETGVILATSLGAGAVVGATLLHISAHELVPAWVNCSDEKHPQEQVNVSVGHMPDADLGVGMTFEVGLVDAVGAGPERLQITGQESVWAAANCSDVKHPHEQANVSVGHMPDADFAAAGVIFGASVGAVVGAVAAGAVVGAGETPHRVMHVDPQHPGSRCPFPDASYTSRCEQS